MADNLSTASPVSEETGAVLQHWEERLYVYLFRYCSPVMLAISTVGNLLALVVLLSGRMRRSSTNLILVVLAVADLGTAYTGLLRDWLLFLTGFDVRALNIHVCRAHMYFTYCTFQLSMAALCVVAVERALIVCSPLKARAWCRRSNMIRALVAIGALIAALGLSQVVTVTFDQSLAEQGHRCFYRDDVKAAMYLFLSIVQSYIPFAVIAVSNCVIICMLARANKLRTHHAHTGTGSAQESGVRNTTVMLVAVSLVFLVTNLPFSIYISGERAHWPLTEGESVHRARSLLAYAVTYELSCLNNAINMVLYCIFGRAFRQALVDVLLCRPRRREGNGLRHGEQAGGNQQGSLTGDTKL